MAVVEDLGMARRMKRAGLSVQVVFGPGLLRLRWAMGAAGIVRVVTKNFFAVFAFRPELLLAGGALVGTASIRASYRACDWHE